MSLITITNNGEPTTPASGKTAIYSDSTAKTLYTKDDAGVVTAYGAGNVVKVSSNDSTAGYLEDKIVVPATSGLAVSTLNDGADEDVQIALDINGTTDKAAPVVGDELLLGDSEDSNNIKKADLASVVNKADHDALTNFVSNEHVDHSSVNITTTANTSGLTGGGDLTASRSLSVDINGTTDKATPVVGDELLLSDSEDSNSLKKADLASVVNKADHDALTNFVAAEHYRWDNDISGTATINLANIEMQEIGTATYDDIQDWYNITQSAGLTSGGTLSDGGSGTVDVASGTGILKTTDSNIGTNVFFNFAGTSGLALTDNSINWVYIDYNAGTPTYGAVTDWLSLDLHTQIIVGSVYREGTTVHITNTCQCVDDFDRRVMQMNYEKDGNKRVSGMVIGETGTRNLTVTAGAWYAALTRSASSAFDTSAASTFTYIYRDGGGGWTKVSSQTQINNANYDDGDGTLGTLTANRYGVHWVYYELDDEIYIQYGQGDYTLAQAELAKAPTTSSILSNHAILLGKIIIQQGASSFTSIESAFDTVFVGTLAADHGALAGLGDDDHTQYALLLGRSGGQTLIGGTASGNSLLLQSTANATKGTIALGSLTTGFVYDETNVRASIGSNSNTMTIGGTTYGCKLHVDAEGGTDLAEVCFGRHSDTVGFGGHLLIGRTRGTHASQTVVQSGDVLSRIDFLGHDGTDMALAGQIDCEVDGTPGAGDMPGRILFKTTPDGAETPTEKMRIDNAGNVGIANNLIVGATSTQAISGVTPSLQSLGTGSGDTATLLGRWSADAGEARLWFLKSRNATIGSNTIVQNGDVLGKIQVYADDGTDYATEAAHIRFVVNGTPGANDMPTDMVFATTADGAAAATDRLRISSAGAITIAALNTANGLVQTDGSGVLSTTLTPSGLTSLTAATLNGTSAIQLNGTSINTGGTLSNVAYLDQSNAFTNAIPIDSTSATSARPILRVTNTNADALSPEFRFVKDSASPADDDELGNINFYGDDSGGTSTKLAYITAYSSDITDTTEAGELTLGLRMNGTPRNFLNINGYNGTANQGEIVFNEDSQDVDFRVESDTNTNAFFINGATSSVGMGTNAPDVAGFGTGDTTLTINGNTTNGNGNIELLTYNAITSDEAFLGSIDFYSGPAVTNRIARMYAKTSGTAGTAGQLVFATDNGSTLAERVRIDENGYVGIGSDTPQSLLEVRGPIGVGADGAGTIILSTAELTVASGDQLGRIDFNAPLESSGTDANLVAATIYAESETSFSSIDNSTSLVFGTGASEAATAKMKLTSLGYLGIGATTPDKLLHIQSATTGEIHLENTGNSAAQIYIDADRTTADSVIGRTEGQWNGTATSRIDHMAGTDTTNKDDGWLRFQTRASGVAMAVAMELTTSQNAIFYGDVGIGTITPSNELSVVKAATSSVVNVTSYSDTSTHIGALYLEHARGTEASPTATQSGDFLGGVYFRGWDTDMSSGAAIFGEAAAEWGTASDSTDSPANLTFYTCTDGSSNLTERFRIDYEGKLSTGGEASPDVDTGGLCLNQGANDGKIFSCKSSDVSHAMTGIAEADTYFYKIKAGASNGGILQIGLSEATISHQIWGIAGTASPDTTTSTSGNGVVELIASKTNGATSHTTLGATENILVVKNLTTTRVIFKGNGNVEADGTVTSGSFDFAEYFESLDGQAIPNGTPVVLVGRKIRAAIEGEIPFGVISATAGFIGNQGLDWKNKYIKDNFGAIILDENNQPTLNPEYNPELEFVSRKDRVEWNIVGLVGQIYVKKDSPVNPNWILLEDANEEANLYLVK